MTFVLSKTTGNPQPWVHGGSVGKYGLMAWKLPNSLTSNKAAVLNCDVVSGEITYGFGALAMFIQNKTNVHYDIDWIGDVKHGDVFYKMK